MNLNIITDFDSSIYRELNIRDSQRLIVLTCDEMFWDYFKRDLKKFDDRNNKRVELGKEKIKLELNIKSDSRSRLLSQNAWMWAAHTLEANFLNGNKSAWTDEQGIRWREADCITPEMVHQDYMERYAIRGYIDVDASLVHSIASRMEAEVGHVMNREGLPDGKVRLEIWKTSSYLSIAEFCALGDKIERQMLSYGVTFREAREFLKLSADLEEYHKKAKEEIKGKDWAAMTDEEKETFDRYRYYEEKGIPLY